MVFIHLRISEESNFFRVSAKICDLGFIYGLTA